MQKPHLWLTQKILDQKNMKNDRFDNLWFDIPKNCPARKKASLNLNSVSKMAFFTAFFVTWVKRTRMDIMPKSVTFSNFWPEIHQLKNRQNTKKCCTLFCQLGHNLLITLGGPPGGLGSRQKLTFLLCLILFCGCFWFDFLTDYFIFE